MFFEQKTNKNFIGIQIILILSKKTKPIINTTNPNHILSIDYGATSLTKKFIKKLSTIQNISINAINFDKI